MPRALAKGQRVRQGEREANRLDVRIILQRIA